MNESAKTTNQQEVHTMTLYYNTVRQNAKNAFYPCKIVIQSVEDLTTVVSYDHVCAKYNGSYRKNENFIEADCSMFDVDNSETDNPDEWITPENVRDAFPGVPFYVSYSRNHMKQKGQKAPRPKFHVYFPDVRFSDKKEYREHKSTVCNYFIKFDHNAKDAARFFYGVENPQVQFYDGNTLLYNFMQTICENDGTADKLEETNAPANTIPEGTRNNTMYRHALTFLTRYGTHNKVAYKKFILESQKCSPPLADSELSSIWESALKYYNSVIATSNNYIAPELYHFENQKISFELPVSDYKILFELSMKEKKMRTFNIDICRMLLQAFGVKVRYNEMSHDIVIKSSSPKLDGENSHELLATALEDTLKKLAYKGNNRSAIYNVLYFIANENCYHPVIELLDEQPWDGTDRLSELYQMMGLSDELHMTLVRKWALQSIAVLFNSKEKSISSQGILVLQGGQGIGKTEFFRHLAIKDEFFKGGAVLDMRNKDTIISATGVWICELGEIDSTTNKKQSELKAFITEQYDRYREPYARKEVQRFRKTSFCGTVNPAAYLTDETGNRRYWTIPVKNMNIDKIFKHTPEWYTQFWRQMYSEYKRNPMGFLLTKDEQAEVNRSNEKFETLLKGEDEFMTIFDTAADQSEWNNRLTAAQVANILNSHFKSLNISSVSVGRNLIPRIEKRTGKKFQNLPSNGSKYKLYPPFADGTVIDLPSKTTPSDHD